MGKIRFGFGMRDQASVAAGNSTVTLRSASSDGASTRTSCRSSVADEEGAGRKGVATSGGDLCETVHGSEGPVDSVSSGSEARRHQQWKMKGYVPREQHHFQGDHPPEYLDGVIPAMAASPHPPVMYMMPPWAGYRCPMPSSCVPFGEYGPMRGHCSPIGGSFSVRSAYSNVDTTFDSRQSALSLFESPCVKPCEGIGRMIGTTVTAFVDGLRSTLDYGEEMCYPKSSSQPSPVVGEAGPWPSSSTAVAAPPTGVVAGTPHPDGQASERISEKMDELLRLLKEKESEPPAPGTSASGSDEGHRLLEGDSGGGARGTRHEVVGSSPPAANPMGTSELKEKADEQRKEAWANNPPSVGGGDIPVPTFRFPESARKASIDVDRAVKNLKCKDSELLAITNGLEVDLAVDNGNDKRLMGMKAREEKADSDELSREYNSKGLSISGAMEPSAKENGCHEEAPSPSPPLPEAQKEKANGNDRWGRPSRGRVIKNILRDIKNVPREIKGGVRGSPRDIAKKKGRTAPRVTGGGRKKKPSVGMRVAMITDERPSRSDPTFQQHKQGLDEGPFLADFSSRMTIDSMGFPSPPLTNKLSTSSSSRKAPGGGGWEGDFSRGDNPFSAGSTDVARSTPDDAVAATAGAEKRVCAWCRKGGSGNGDISQYLKLCSICRSTYYCSPECQLKDWRKGHALICRPAGSTATTEAFTQ